MVALGDLPEITFRRSAKEAVYSYSSAKSHCVAEVVESGKQKEDYGSAVSVNVSRIPDWRV